MEFRFSRVNHGIEKRRKYFELKKALVYEDLKQKGKKKKKKKKEKRKRKKDRQTGKRKREIIYVIR